MTLLAWSGFQEVVDQTDYFVEEAILEAQFNIRLRRSRNTEQNGVNGMNWQECTTCGSVWNPRSDTKQCMVCEGKLQEQQKTVEDNLVKNKIDYDNNPDFLEIH
jgi:DnaJ-class molecular chaperone